MSHLARVVVEAAQDFSLKIHDGVALRCIAEPGLFHFEGCFVWHGEKVYLSHLHLQDYRPIVLLHSNSLIVVHRVLLWAPIFLNELDHDRLCHEAKVDFLSEALLYLMVLPVESKCNVRNLVGLFCQE